MFIPRVLIADHDASYAQKFRAGGWEVLTAPALGDVAPLAHTHKPDLVLLPVRGPAELEVLGALRVPVAVTCTAPELRVQCLDAGAMAFLLKTPSEATVNALKKVMETRRVAPRVLLSEDDPLVLRTLERAARNEGLDPVSTLDSRQVVDLARELKPATIVLDIEQPRLDGRDVLTKLKENPETRDIRVVMLTGIDDQQVRHDCFSLGADDYVVKPLDPLFFVRIARRINEERLN